MMKTIFRTGFALGLSLAVTTAGAQPAQKQPLLVRTSASYSCGAGPSSGCPFLLYTSDCKEGAVKNGYPSLVCTHEVFAEFTLKPGESKKFDSLPPNVKQCQPRNGRLAFPECML